jgi:hypothetical protein
MSTTVLLREIFALGITINFYGSMKGGLFLKTPACGDSIKPVTPGWVATKMGGVHAPDDPQQGPETQVWLASSGLRDFAGGVTGVRPEEF